MYNAPLHETPPLSHQKEREAWARRLREERETSPPARAEDTKPIRGLSGDAALVGLILFLLSDRTAGDGVLLLILVYLLLH